MTKNDTGVPILVIDGTRNHCDIADSLVREGYRVIAARDASDGLGRAVSLQPDLILLDAALPGIGAIEVCRRLKSQEQTRDIPVIFMTSSGLADKAGLFGAGGADCIAIPFHPDEALARIGTHVALRAAQRRLAKVETELRDRDERLQQKKTLHEAQCARLHEQIAAVAAAMPGGLYTARLDADGRSSFPFASTGVEEFFGISAAAIRNDAAAVRAFYHPEDLPRIKAATEESRQTLTPYRIEFRVVLPARGTRWVEARARPHREPDGATVWHGIVLDISERKAIEEALRISEREFRTLAENTPDVIVRYDTECRRVYVNPAFERVNRLSAKEVLGKRPTEVSTKLAPFAVSFTQELRTLMAAGSATTMELVSEEDGKPVCWYVRAIPERNELGQVCGVLTIRTDFTERKETERRLRESYKLLGELTSRRETAREEERKHIARELHDELGQHLTALRMGISTLRIQFGRANPALIESVANLVALTDKTIQVVRNAATMLRPASLDAGICSALEWLASEFEQNTDIACRLSVPTEDCFALDEKYAMALFRIVQESLTNVARHARTDTVDVSLMQQGNSYVAEVRDYGKGFDPANVRGKSFGLMCMRERALMLGGELHVESKHDDGTAIKVRIPVPGARETA